LQQAEGVVDFGDRGEKVHGLVDIHGQYVADMFALVTHRESFVVKTPAVADVAGYAYIGQKIHFYFLFALPAAAITAAVASVKGKACGAVAAQSGVHGTGKKFANGIPDADIG